VQSTPSVGLIQKVRLDLFELSVCFGLIELKVRDNFDKFQRVLATESEPKT